MLFVFALFFSFGCTFARSTECSKIQPYVDEYVNYTTLSYHPTDSTKIKIVYEQIDDLPNSILLDWMSDELYEFNIHYCTFQQDTFDLADAAFHKYLQKMAVTSSGLTHIENSKKHCIPPIFLSLHTINFSYNKIKSFNGEIFQNMPVLRVLYLIGNQVQTITHINQIIPKTHLKSIWIGEINYLDCSTLQRIMNSLDFDFRVALQFNCNMDIPVKCHYMKNLTCFNHDQIYSPFPLFEPYFNNAVRITSKFVYFYLFIHLYIR